MDLRHFSKAGPRNGLKIFLRARCVSASRLRGARIEQSRTWLRLSLRNAAARVTVRLPWRTPCIFPYD
jgi:hypothetical protein